MYMYLFYLISTYGCYFSTHTLLLLSAVWFFVLISSYVHVVSQFPPCNEQHSIPPPVSLSHACISSYCVAGEKHRQLLQKKEQQQRQPEPLKPQ